MTGYNKEFDPKDPRFRPVKGWAEVLYRQVPAVSGIDGKTPVRDLPPHRVKQEDYLAVGSWLPLDEYIHTLDIAEQYLGDISGVPRHIQGMDVINMCPADPPSILTFLVADRDSLPAYASYSPQHHSKSSLILVPMKKPFQSFRFPGWPADPGRWRDNSP